MQPSHLYLDGFGVLAQAHERVFEQHVDLVETRYAGTQGGLKLRLIEHEGRLPAKRTRRGHRVEPLDDVAVHTNKIGSRMWASADFDLFGKACRLECTHRLVVGRDSAWFVVDALLAFDNRNSHALGAKQIGKRDSGRTVASNDSVVYFHDLPCS